MRPRPTARAARRAVALLVALALVVGLAGCRVTRRDRPVLLVHGWSATGGTSCSGTFDGVIAQLRDEGFTGPFVKVGFYTGDTGCDMTLRSWGDFANGSSWREVAKALSHYVAATYTAHGIPVDVVGYSMGGNIARGAVQGSAAGEAGFSGPIRVEDVVTVAAPHDGAAWYSHLCLWGQCATLKPGAADIEWLDRDPDPQGEKGTEWTVMGSHADAVTPLASALQMGVPDERKVVYDDVPHTGDASYLRRSEVVTRIGLALAAPNA